MKILADENIPYVREVFSGLGEVTTVPGRDITAAAVHDATMLLVRSVTKVNEALLAGSSVRFVATATIGEDHVDRAWLASRGIAFASAPGSNANSVGEYIVVALLELAGRFGLNLAGLKLGIVGVGNVGKCVLTKARALGMECVLNDPPLERATGDPKYRPMDEIVDCNIVTLHVPLAREGLDATYHLVDESFLTRLNRGAILINSARGPVVDGEALKKALDGGQVRACVLDVWEREPDIDVSLLERVAIGTPHIAGYSFDGKVNGTRQIYEAACAFCGSQISDLKFEISNLKSQIVDGTADDALRTTVRAAYNIMGDDAVMRRLVTMHDVERPKEFDRLRKEYPRRREFFNTQVRVVPPNAALEEQLAGIGFRIE